MLDVFKLTFNKVGVLLIYIAVGYFLRRKRCLPEEAGRVLSLLCTLVFLPAYYITNLAKNMRLEVIGDKLLLVGAGAIFILVAILLGHVLGRCLGRTEMEKNSLIYAFTFANYGYFGYPVIEGVFGSALLADFMIFLTPVSLLTGSYGYALFQKESKFSLKRILKTPMVIGLLIGVAVGLSGLRMPSVLNTALSGAGSCMSPCSMLLAGFMLGKFPLKQLFSGVRPYYLAAIHMLGIPLIFGTVLFLCGVRGTYLFMPLVFACLPLGLNLVVYPESFGYEKEAGDNAKLCFISYVLALIVLPCIFAILTRLM